MKKALIAAAVAGAFAAPSAMAAELSTNIYWSTGISVGETTTTGAVTPGVDSTVNDDTVKDGGGNRVMFTWTDTLDNGIGLTAYMSFQTSASTGNTGTTTGLGTINSRNSHIGFSGDFGTVKVGTNEHFAETDLILDPNFADYGGGDALGHITVGITGFSFTRFDGDSIWWNSKDMNGFSAKAAYIMGPTAVAGIDPKGMQIGANYTTGPLRVGLSQATYEDYNDAGTASAAIAGTEAQMTTFTASYDMGMAMVKVGAWTIEQSGTTTEATINGYEVEGRSAYVGMPVGGGTLWAQTSSLGDRDATVTATGVTSAVAGSGKDSMSVGFIMPMNANVNFFGRYDNSDTDLNFDATAGSTNTEAMMFGWQLMY